MLLLFKQWSFPLPRLNPVEFKRLPSVGTLWYNKRVLTGLLLQDTEKQEFLLDVLQVLRLKAKFE